MKKQLSILRNALSAYFTADKAYDGSAGAASGRERLRMSLYGSLPWGINHDRFEQVLRFIPASWSIEGMVDYAAEWVERELARRPVAPKVF